MVRRSSNFRDPIGLVLRMLASGNRAAYGALMREALRIAATPVDVCLSGAERRCVRSHQDGEGRPLVLVVGAPRSGTTLVYQVLAHCLDVTFPTNATSVLSRSPITATLWQQKDRSLECPDFRSFYGQTSRLSDCSDGFDIWNRWLGTDRYVPGQDIGAEAAEDMRRFFTAWTAAHGRPFLNKNNRNALAIALLAKHLPHARFVVIRRNPVMVAQSLIVARRKVQGSRDAGWGLGCSTTSGEADPLAYVDAVCRQIATIEATMNEQLATVAADRVVEATYEGFCENPCDVVDGVVDRFDGVSRTPGVNAAEIRPFSVSTRLTMSDAECERVHQCLGRTRHSDDVVSC